MQIGNRILYDQDGKIIAQLGEMQGDVPPRKIITELHYVDLDYGAINHETHRLVSIDPVTKQPILEKIEREKTPEEKYIEEMEDALLLAADAEIGGIL